VDIISEKIVEETWKETSGIPLQDAPKLAQRFQKLQPFLNVYLLAAGGDELNRDERELLFYLGMVVWKMMAKGAKELTQVSSNTIDKEEEKNWDMLNYLSGESKSFDFVNTVESIVAGYNQKNILKYVVEALEEHDTEEGNIRDDKKGEMFIYLKTVIDCLDQ
jgi:hypothetical protein